MNLFGQGDFQIDANTTPEMLREKRARLAMLMPQYGKARYVGEGIGQLLSGIGTGRQIKAMDKFQGERSADAGQQFAAATGGPLNILGMPPQDQPAAAPSGGQMASEVTPAVASPSDRAGWLQYANQGATRSQPINEQLQSSLSFLPDMGVQMQVFSGGQDAEGPKRTGSHRHDRGGAADVFFMKDGRKLDWNNPQDQPIFAEVVKKAKERGVTGFGAGEGYMQPGSMHVGFGSPAVWGADGKGANAAEWLQQAYNGSPAGKPITGQPMQGGQDMDALMQAAANPWLTPEQRSVVQNMISQRQGQQSSAEDRYWKQQDPAYQLGLQKGQLEIDAMRNPAPPKGTSDMQEYQFALSQGYKGTFQDYMMGMKKAGATNVTVGGDGAPGLGKLSSDYGYVLDPATGQPVIDPQTGLPKAAPIPGSPAAQDIERLKNASIIKDGNAATSTSVITTAASRASDAAKQREFGGFGSNLIGKINQYSDSAEVQRQVEVLKSNAKIENLTAMRAASPTGGALGAVSDKESEMLAAKSGAIDPSSPNFERDLDDYERTLLRVVHGPEAGDRIYEQTRPGAGPDADGWQTINGVKVRVKQ